MNKPDVSERICGARWLLAVLVLASSSCSPTVAQYASYAGTDDDGRVWPAFEPGARIVLFDPNKACDATIAEDEGSLDGGRRLGTCQRA